MHRFVSVEHREMVRDIASSIAQAYPGKFKPLGSTRPHASILGQRYASNFLSNRGVSDPEAKAVQFIRRIQHELPPSSFVPTEGEGVFIDTFGNKVGLVLDGAYLASELDVVFSGLSTITGQPYRGNRSSHISLGDVMNPGDSMLVDELTSSAAVVCGLYLPADRKVYLGPVSLKSPS